MEESTDHRKKVMNDLFMILKVEEDMQQTWQDMNLYEQLVKVSLSLTFSIKK